MTTDPSSLPAPAAPDPARSQQTATALGRIPSGLFVITWRGGDADRVMLASWVMQAGLEPPLVSVAIKTSRDLLAVARAGSPFVINVLAESQRPLLARFGKPIPDGEEPFAGLAIERTADGVATLTGVSAWLSCRMVGEVEVETADHVVVLGQVEMAAGSAEIDPLVHIRRNGLRY